MMQYNSVFTAYSYFGLHNFNIHRQLAYIGLYIVEILHKLPTGVRRKLATSRGATKQGDICRCNYDIYIVIVIMVIIIFIFIRKPVRNVQNRALQSLT